MEKITIQKVRLKDIVKNEEIFDIINDAVNRCNLLCTHLYQFLRLWILTLDDIPELNENIFKMALRALVVTQKLGRQPQGKNKEHFNNFLEFYNNTYSKLDYVDKINSLNLSGIFNYMFVQVKTGLENNIKSHFYNHVNRFVNSHFKPHIKAQCDEIENHNKLIEFKKEKYSELGKVKKDLFDNTRNSPQIYHEWINTHRRGIFPADHSHEKLYTDPQSYIKHMLYLSKQLGLIGAKQFQFFPLRSSLIPKHITLDTKALIELFSRYKGNDLKHVTEIRDEVWDEVFRTSRKAFQKNKYTFNYMITTNGYDCSVIFISNDDYEKHESKKKNRVLASNKAKKLTKHMTEKQKRTYKENKAETDKEAKKQKYKESKSKGKKTPTSEFKYVEDLSEAEKTRLNTDRCGIIDFGKIRIITMLDTETDKIFKYTNRTHLHRTRRLVIANKSEKLKDLLGITKAETSLSEYNGKSCDIDKFSEFIKNRNQRLLQLTKAYALEDFRKWKFHLYINKTRDRDILVNSMKKFLGDKKNPTLICGDWSANRTMKHNISTPGIGLKRYLAKSFQIYNLDEFRSSCLHYKTEKRCSNLWVKKNANKKLKRPRKIHSVLTCKMENKRLGCINRDRNAVYNMKKFVKHIAEHGTYPYKYRRSTKAED